MVNHTGQVTMKHKNQHKGRTVNTEPTLCDQSQANQTDINIILNQFLKTGQAPGTANPIYGDFTQIPTDLRGFIEMGRSMNTLRSQLPEQLREIPPTVLFNMTDAEILAKITPADKPADNKEETPK
ncbi:MAG: internal scaffolding protein [Microvirus sp.]|nr:MAG: internal scaffolding protein [Microvirus sp.]